MVTPDAPLRAMQAQLKMKHLLFLRALHDSMNLHRAAEELGIGQPAATALLKNIEAMLGVEVFGRGGRGLTANQYTATIVQWAEATLAKIRNAAEDVSALAQGAQAQIAVGSAYSPVPTIVAPAIAELGGTHPDLIITVQTGTAGGLLPELRAGRLGCVIAHLAPDTMQAGLHHSVLYEETVDFVVGTHHPLAAYFVLGDLDDYRWIMPMSRGDIYDQVANKLVSFGLAIPRVGVETWLNMTTIGLLRDTDFIAVLPRSISRALARHGLFSILPLDWSTIYFPVGIITRADEASPALLGAVITALKTAARALPTAYARHGDVL